MTSPKAPPKIKLVNSLNARELRDHEEQMERDAYIDLLAEYLTELRRESLWVMQELAAHDIDPVAYLHTLNAQDAAEDDCANPSWVH